MALQLTEISFDPGAPEGYRVSGTMVNYLNGTGAKFTVPAGYPSEVAADALTLGQIKADILARFQQDFPSLNT
ncbi:hypothetical protein LMG1866_03778 [Achromobacter ruhlandii]|uniref:hypothetical protein n=1 Tax=Achromobacter ruhlandii TaxID=72557 RepID=UPI00146716E9|nr:hypothetical protein [Achromobacter ruhlandii]CAB3720667.1 hypothetical protein LMG1866_03778 [Achromobacter ruhlandii]